MGTSAVGVLSDDVARDVRDAFLMRFSGGLRRPEIVRAIEMQFADEWKDEDDAPVVRLALAKLLWDRGWLTPKDVRAIKAMVDSGAGLGRWEEAGPRSLAKRKAALRLFVKQLDVTNPNPRKWKPPKPPTQRKAIFRVGECVSVRFKDGRHGAFVVLAEEARDPARKRETYGGNVVGLVDWIAAKRPEQRVFESGKWLRLTHHSWNNEVQILSVTSQGFRGVAQRFKVVGATKLRKGAPAEAKFGAGWDFADQLLLQEQWDRRATSTAVKLSRGSTQQALFATQPDSTRG